MKTARAAHCSQRVRPDRKATIGFFGPYEEYGGTEQYLNLLMRPVAEMGYPVVFFHRSELPSEWINEVAQYARTVPYGGQVESDVEEEEMESVLRRNGLRHVLRTVHRNASPRLLRYLVWFGREVERFRRLFVSWPVQVLHAPDLAAEPWIIGAKLAGIPRVTGALGCLPRTDAFRSTFSYRLLERLCLGSVDAIAAVSRHGRELWARRLHVVNRNTRVIYNGIGLPSEDSQEARCPVRKEAGIPARALVIGVSAALTPLKGHVFLLGAFPEVLKVVPDAWVLLAGDGPCRTPLEQQARRLGVAERVTFLGHRRDMDRIVEAYDVVALPSAMESLPFSLLEGMARGKPVVASAVGGIPELVDDGVCGHVVPVGDTAAIARALIAILKEPERMRLMGEAAARRVARDFSVQRMVEQTVQLMLGNHKDVGRLHRTVGA